MGISCGDNNMLESNGNSQASGNTVNVATGGSDADARAREKAREAELILASEKATMAETINTLANNVPSKVASNLIISTCAILFVLLVSVLGMGAVLWFKIDAVEGHFKTHVTKLDSHINRHYDLRDLINKYYGQPTGTRGNSREPVESRGIPRKRGKATQETAHDEQEE